MPTARIMKWTSLCLFGLVFFLPFGCTVGKHQVLMNFFICLSLSLIKLQLSSEVLFLFHFFKLN